MLSSEKKDNTFNVSLENVFQVTGLHHVETVAPAESSPIW